MIMEYTYDGSWITNYRKRYKWVAIIVAVSTIFALFEMSSLDNINLNDNNQLFNILFVLADFFWFLFPVYYYSTKETVFANLLKNKLVIGEKTISGYQCDNFKVKDNVSYFEVELEDVKSADILSPVTAGPANDFHNLIIFCKNKTIKLAITKNEEAKNVIIEKVCGVKDTVTSESREINKDIGEEKKVEKEMKKEAKLQPEIDPETIPPAVPEGHWRCMGCGEILPDSEAKCKCGYKKKSGAN